MLHLSEMYRHCSALAIKWGEVRYFERKEWSAFGGVLETTSALLVYALDEFRENLGHPVWLSPRTWGEHQAGSYHYPTQRTNFHCWAIDIFPECSLLWAYHTAMRSKLFAGIGVYPFWEFSRRGILGGLHLDIRLFETNKRVWFYDGPAKKGKYRSVHNAQDLQDMMELLCCLEA